MPKLKTHKSTARRFRITSTGKVMRTKGGKSHFRRRRAPRVKRTFAEMFEASKPDSQKVKKLLPYGV